MSSAPQEDTGLSKLKGKYGLQPANDDCIGECEPNSLVVPKLFRYLGMGHYEILADVKDHPNKYFVVHAGGSNGYDRQDSYNDLIKLTIKEAKSFEEVVEYLKRTTWDEVVNVVEADHGTINSTVTHDGSEQ